MHRHWILPGLAAFLAVVSPGLLRAEDFAFYHENVLGTSLELLVSAETEAQARGAEGRVLAEIDRLAAILSGHDAGSEFRRWLSSRGPRPVSAELYAVLEAAERYRGLSAGAFDARVEAISRIWRDAAVSNQRPSEQVLRRAVAALASADYRLDPARRTAERLGLGPLSLDGIAKGYIVERASRLAAGPGVQGILLNIGGDLRVVGARARTVAIVAPWADSEGAEPLVTIAVHDRSVATSGRSQRGFRIAGEWYSHVLDPRTGRPVERTLEAVVVAPGGVDADALAKAVAVLEPGAARALAASIPGVEYLIVTADRRLIRSAGFAALEHAAAGQAPGREPAQAQASPTQTQPGAAAKSEVWDPRFEVKIDYEINQPPGNRGRYRRPYVVVWVEDETGRSVRTLILWVSMGGQGPFRWLPDLKRWYKGDQARKKSGKKDLFFTLARPTRAAGKYQVVWDGKNDEGQLVPRGKYTISIEAAREHGTYQIIRKVVTLGEKPFVEELKGNVEIKSAAIEYREKSP